MLVCAFALAGCASAAVGEAEDGENDAFVGPAGAADAFGIVEGSADARGVLRVANELDEAALRSAAGLARRPAHGIAVHRAGDDALLGTPDDDRFDTLVELDRVPYVGRAVFASMLALARAQGWVVETPPPPPPTPTAGAVLRLLGDYTREQHGALVPGDRIVVEYAMSRLPGRNTHNGFPCWDIQGYVRFAPGGETFWASANNIGDGAVVGATQVASTKTDDTLALAVEVPAGSTHAELWFRGYTGCDSPSETFDSNFGANWGFDVMASHPEAVGWAGDWGGSFARDCAHRDGLAEPVVIDGYVVERACAFVDADVWIPGTTDAATAHPEQVQALVDWSIDGGAENHTWLSFVGRVGNNYRYRWSLPYELRAQPWDSGSFALRFSTDGASWYRIAGADGTARTLVRQP